MKFCTEIISTSNLLLVPVKLTFDIGWCDQLELQGTIDILFHAWNIFREKQYHSRSYAFTGTMRRFFIAHDAKRNIVKPYFSLLGLLSAENKDLQGIEHKLYLSWMNALKNHKDIAVNFEVLKKESIAEEVRLFCTADTIKNTGSNSEPTRVGRDILEVVMKAKGSHRFFAASGIFKGVLNRHVSVQNNG